MLPSCNSGTFDQDRVEDAFQSPCFGVPAMGLPLLLFERLHGQNQHLKPLPECRLAVLWIDE